MKHRIYLSAIAAVMISLVFSCKKEDPKPTSNELDRKPMLENYANNYIVPAYDKMYTQLTTLQQEVAAFAAAPDNNTLAAARAALYNAYLTWQSTDLYEFGPAEGAALRSFMNTYPVTVSKLNNNIASGSYDLETFGNKDAQGFPALDYLLNGLGIAEYTTDAQAAGRKKYLADVINKMIEKTGAVKNEWNTYKTTFVNNTGTDVNSSLSQMVNGYVLYYERYFRSGKIGIPAGAMTGTALPGHVESLYAKEHSLKYAQAAMDAVMDFYAAKTATGASMQSYLAAIGTKDDNGTLMADLVEQEMRQAKNKISSLSGTLYDNINNNRTAVLETYDEVQDVVPLLKVDMVSAFSISITYTDNDGD